MKTEAGGQPKKDNPLEIKIDPVFQQRSWRAERMAWMVIAVLLLAALLGLFGDGVFSHAKAVDASGALEVEYERLARASAPLRLQLRAWAPQAGEVQVWLSRAYLDEMCVEAISPLPEQVEATADQLIYRFRTPSAGTRLNIIFQLTPQHAGRLSGQAGMAAGAQVNFHSFIYP